jgi:hypothetical protein
MNCVVVGTPLRLLVVTPDGREHQFNGADDVRFGRRLDLELRLVGGKPAGAMSRHVGTFRFVDGRWRVRNEPGPPGSRGNHKLWVVGLEAPRVEVPAGGELPLPAAGVVMFPPGAYELPYRIDGARADSVPPTSDGVGTSFPISLTAAEVDYLVTLAEPELRGTPTRPHRMISEVAMMWGVDRDTVDAALRSVRRKLVGVGWIRNDDDGTQGITHVLVRLAVDEGLINLNDLKWAQLDASSGPRRAAHGPRFRSEQ